MVTKSLSRDANLGNLGAKTSSGSRKLFINRIMDKTSLMLDKAPVLYFAGAVLFLYGASMLFNPSKAEAQTQPSYNQDSNLVATDADPWGPIRLTAMDVALKDCNATLEANKTTKAYFNRGSVLFGMKRYEEALADFNEAIRLDPANASAYANRGYTYLALGHIEQADSNFDKAITLEPGFAKAYVGRGSALNELGSCKEALAEFDKALELEPNNVQALIGRGDAFMGLKDYKKALKAFERAAELDPNSVPALNGIGYANLALGNYDGAGKVFERAIAEESLRDAQMGVTSEDVQRGLTGENQPVKRNPPIARAYYGLSIVCKKLGFKPEQVEWLRNEAFKRDSLIELDYNKANKALKGSHASPSKQPSD